MVKKKLKRGKPAIKSRKAKKVFKAAKDFELPAAAAPDYDRPVAAASEGAAPDNETPVKRKRKRK